MTVELTTEELTFMEKLDAMMADENEMVETKSFNGPVYRRRY